MTYKIYLNEKNTHSLEITEENMLTIQKYGLFDDLVDSNGYVDETILDKLKFNIRSLLANSEGNSKDLLDLCIDIIYHDKMKSYGLSQLLQAYEKWVDVQYTNDLVFGRIVNYVKRLLGCRVGGTKLAFFAQLKRRDVVIQHRIDLSRHERLKDTLFRTPDNKMVACVVGCG